MKQIAIVSLHQNLSDYLNMLTFLRCSFRIIRCTDSLSPLCDGLLLPGDSDCCPQLYGQKNKGSRDVCLEEDLLQLSALERYRHAGLPVLGIDKGMHLINLAFGGSLRQHIGRYPHDAVRFAYGHAPHALSFSGGSRSNPASASLSAAPSSAASPYAISASTAPSCVTPASAAPPCVPPAFAAPSCAISASAAPSCVTPASSAPPCVTPAFAAPSCAISASAAPSCVTPASSRETSRTGFLVFDRYHSTCLREGSMLEALYGAALFVNSRHHQALDRIGIGLEAVQLAFDGCPEAVQHRTLPIIGVQWHPERLLPGRPYPSGSSDCSLASTSGKTGLSLSACPPAQSQTDCFADTLTKKTTDCLPHLADGSLLFRLFLALS